MSTIASLLAAMQGNSGGYQPGYSPTAPAPDTVPGQSAPNVPTPSAPQAVPAPVSSPASIAPQVPPQAPQQPQMPQQQAFQQPPPPGPQGSGIKGYLASMLYGMGEAGKKHIGLPTDYEIQQNQMNMQMKQQQASADLFAKQSEALYRQNMTAQNAAGPITDPQEAKMLGVDIGTMLSPVQKFAILKQNSINQGLQSRGLQAAQVQALARMSQTSMKAAYMPDGTLGVGLYDKAGNFRGYADNAVVPAAYLEKIRHGQEFKVDADGTLQAIPTTSTSAPMVPAPPNPNSNKLISPPQSNTPPKPSGNILKPPTLPGQQPAAPGINAKPVMVNGQPFQSATANDTVYAFDKQSGQTIATTRQDAGAKGLQITANKVSPVQVRKDESLSNRLADVQRKVGDYASTFDGPELDDQDKLAISYLADHNIGAGLSAHGLSLNVLPGYVQSQLKAQGMQGLSPEGMKRYILFNQARESLSGYQQILTNSSRASDKILELQLEQLPPPIAPKDFANMTTEEFQKNIDLAGQHIPMFPGSAETQQGIKAQQQLNRKNNAYIQSKTGGDMIQVQIPGQAPGQIHKSQWNNFKAKYPNATQVK